MTPRSRLLWTWALLMGLTALSLTAADAASAGATARLGLGPVAVVLGAGVFKAVQILWNFLDLRRSTTLWQATFVVGLVFLWLILFAAYWLSLARV